MPRLPAQHHQLELTSLSLPQIRKLEVGLVEIRGLEAAVGQIGVEETCRFSVAVMNAYMVGGHIHHFRCIDFRGLCGA